MGFCTFVVTCIYMSGGELADDDLKRYLGELNAAFKVGSTDTSIVLKRMERQGYVFHHTPRSTPGQGLPGSITWHVGPRGKEELGPDGALGVAREVYRGYPGTDRDDLESRFKASMCSRE